MSCRSCWWQEGGLCYLEPVDRTADGRSTKRAESRCGAFRSKREVYEAAGVPGDMLVILSERGAR